MELGNIRSARDRVLQYLRLRAGVHDLSVAIEGQLQDIAAEIGMTREALYRTLATLKAEGHLTRTETTILFTKSDNPHSQITRARGRDAYGHRHWRTTPRRGSAMLSTRKIVAIGAVLAMTAAGVARHCRKRPPAIIRWGRIRCVR